MLPDAPVPHPEGHRDDRNAADEVERLPTGGVQEEALVDGQVRGDAPGRRGRRTGEGQCTLHHLRAHIECGRSGLDPIG